MARKPRKRSRSSPRRLAGRRRSTLLKIREASGFGESVELEGPASSELAPPPRRRAGALLAGGAALALLAGLAMLAAIRPQALVGVVQAFAGRF